MNIVTRLFNQLRASFKKDHPAFKDPPRDTSAVYECERCMRRLTSATRIYVEPIK